MRTNDHNIWLKSYLRGSSGHVDNTRSGEINVTNSTEWLSSEGRDESVSTPDRADNNWVDEGGKEERVAEVGLHLASLGDGSGNNGGGSGSEGELEEESYVVTASRESLEGESRGSNERTGSAVGETVSKGVETNGSTTGIQQVLEHDVLDVLLTNGSSTEHGETGLHQEDGSSGEEEEEGVNTSDNSFNCSAGLRHGGGSLGDQGSNIVSHC